MHITTMLGKSPIFFLLSSRKYSGIRKKLFLSLNFVSIYLLFFPFQKCGRIKKMVKKKTSPLKKKLAPISKKIKVKKIPLYRFAPFLALIALLLFLYLKKDWFIVALINKHPITRVEFNRQLEKQYGNQVLETMVNQELIKQEAKKNKIKISDEEIEKNIQKIKESLQGRYSLDDLLASQGITREELKKSIRIQLIAEKLIGKEIQISDEEIENYLENNQDFLQSTEEAEQREEAKESLFRLKVNEKFQEWLEKIRQEAKIFKFI